MQVWWGPTNTLHPIARHCHRHRNADREDWLRNDHAGLCLLFLIHAARLGKAIVDLHRLVNVTIPVGTPHTDLDAYSREFVRMCTGDPRANDLLSSIGDKTVLNVEDRTSVSIFCTVPRRRVVTRVAGQLSRHDRTRAPAHVDATHHPTNALPPTPPDCRPPGRCPATNPCMR